MWLWRVRILKTLLMWLKWVAILFWRIFWCDHEDQDSDKKLKSSVDAISAQRVPEFLQSFQPFNKCYKKPWCLAHHLQKKEMISNKVRNTRKYPGMPGNTREEKRYPKIPDRIFWHSYPTWTRPATRYFVQYPTQPDPILKNPTRWALLTSSSKWVRDPGYLALSSVSMTMSDCRLSIYR